MLILPFFCGKLAVVCHCLPLEKCSTFIKVVEIIYEKENTVNVSTV